MRFIFYWRVFVFTSTGPNESQYNGYKLIRKFKLWQVLNNFLDPFLLLSQMNLCFNFIMRHDANISIIPTLHMTPRG